MFFSKTKKADQFGAFMSGKVIALDRVSDPVFSGRMVGDGYAIIPSSNVVVAPAEGEITVVFPTLHAYGIATKDGVELLIHLGIDTVKLNGEGFISHVSVGDTIKAGEVLAEFDIASAKAKGYDVTSMLIFTSGQKISLLKENATVRANDQDILSINQ